MSKETKTTAGKRFTQVKGVIEYGVGNSPSYSIETAGLKNPIRLTAFLKCLGAAGWGYKPTCELLADAGIPVVSPVSQEERANGKKIIGTTPNTVRSQLHSGFNAARGISGENDNGNNRLHHGSASGEIFAALTKVLDAAEKHYAAKLGTHYFREVAKVSKPKKASKAKK